MTHIPLSQCRLCKGDLSHSPADPILYDPAIDRCEKCRTVQLNFVVDEQKVLYPPFEQKNDFVHRFLSAILGVFNLERKLVMRRGGISFEKDTGRRLLDVGCGAGLFLKSIRRFFIPFGVEPFSFNEKRFPELENSIHFGPLNTLAESAGQFDVITFWQSLEHMENARAMMEKATSLLKPDGKILVSLPNIRSWQARLFRDRWFHLVIPRHVFHFERETLRGFLERCGLRPVFFGTFTLEYGLSGWAQSFLNTLFEKDLFYEWVKARGEFERSGGRMKTAKVIVSLLLTVCLIPVFVILEIASGFFSGGAVWNVVAVKEEKSRV